MDAHETLHRFETGAVFVLLDAPSEGFEFGIDGRSWQAGPLFRGLKMIPPGLHFIYYRLVAKDGVEGALCSFFHFFATREFVVTRWNRVEEKLDFVDDQEEIHRFREGLFELDKFLGPFPDKDGERFSQWSRHLSPSLLDRLIPNSQWHCISAMTSSHHDTLDTFGLVSNSNDRFGFTVINRSKSFDRSEELSAFDFRSLLGELEFCFICLVLGHNFEGFEQWKCIVRLICESPSLAVRAPALITDFVTLLVDQFGEFPDDFFPLAHDNMLYRWLCILVEEGYPNHGMENLVNVARDRFGWDLLDWSEQNDDAPTVVSINE